MWGHPTMDFGHPTTEVVSLILEILSAHGALERSEDAPHSVPAAAHALPAYCIIYSDHISNYESVGYVPVDQCPRSFPFGPKTICCHKPFADEFEKQLRYNSIYSESFTSHLLRSLPSGNLQAHLCVCFLEYRLVVRRHTVGGSCQTYSTYQN
jgi:hypothetical protein